jgi:two-component system chemotaxis response regulator CheB
MHQDPIRVLVIDDSAYSRRSIVHMLERSPLVEVIGSARDGEEALRKTLELEPDLITLDLEMPRMDGFTFLRLVMAKRPTPVMVISGRAGEDDVFKALDLGAVDFVAKPTTYPSAELGHIEESLIRKVHAIRDLRIEKVSDRLAAEPLLLGESDRSQRRWPRAVVIGSSTGGPAALCRTLSAFRQVPPCAFLVAQHMPREFTRGFAERLDRMTPFRVREARDGDVPAPGCVLVAPGGSHLLLERRGERVETRVEPDRAAVWRYVPSIDRLFESAAKQYGERLMAVVLTGMGDDGREGALQVKRSGGRVIAESEETAVIYGMPRQVVSAGAADEILPLHRIPAAIQRGLGPLEAGHPEVGGEDERGRG